MRRIKIEVVGLKDDYACYTAYLWILEIKNLLEEEYNAIVEVEFRNAGDKELREGIPQIRVFGKTVFIGLPSEAGYYLEVLKSYLDKIYGR